MIHDGEAVGQAFGLFHVVRRQQDGLTLGVEAAQEFPQRQTTLGVEAGGGLVEEQHRRACGRSPAPP